MKTKYWSIKVDGIGIFRCYVSRNDIYFYGVLPSYTKKDGDITREDVRKYIKSNYKNEKN